MLAGVGTRSPPSLLPCRRCCRRRQPPLGRRRRRPLAPHALPRRCSPRSHLMVDHEDRSAADKFSVSRLRRSMRGSNGAVPSAVHGAPQVTRGRGLGSGDARQPAGRAQPAAANETSSCQRHHRKRACRAAAAPAALPCRGAAALQSGGCPAVTTCRRRMRRRAGRRWAA